MGKKETWHTMAIPDSIYQEIKQMANTNNRTMAGQLRFILKAFDSQR